MAARSDLHQLCRHSLQTAQIAGAVVDEHFPQGIAVGEQAVQIGVCKGLQRLPGQPHRNASDKLVQLFLHPAVSGDQLKAAGEPDDLSNGGVDHRDGTAQPGIQRRFTGVLCLRQRILAFCPCGALQNAAAYGRFLFPRK